MSLYGNRVVIGGVTCGLVLQGAANGGISPYLSGSMPAWRTSRPSIGVGRRS